MASLHQSDSRTPDLKVLEPSPVDEWPPECNNGNDNDNDNDKQKRIDDYFPSQERPQLARSATALGLSNHGAPYYLVRAHRYSSYIFTAFLTAHITNTSILPLTTSSSASKYLLLTRPYYQSWPIAEPLIIIAPLAVHLASGIALRLHRRRVLLKNLGAETRKDRKTIAWPKLSGTSALGYLAVPLVLGHVAVNRILPWVVDGGSSQIALDWVGHGLSVGPAWYKIAGRVAYAALVGTMGFHVVWGWAQWLGYKPDQVQGVQTAEGVKSAKRRWWGVNGVSIAVVAVWLAGGSVVMRGGRVAGWVGRHYDDLLKRVPFLEAYV